MPRLFTGRPRSRREIAYAGLVGLGLAVYVVLVYVLVVVGGGALIGRTASPSAGLSIAATAIVALGFGRVQGWIEQQASRIVHGGHAAPYDVLRQFSDAGTGGIAAEELPARMARLLAEGVCAQWAQVWLCVEGELALAATWPTGAAESAADVLYPTGRRMLEVRQAGELLGVLVVQERPGVPLTPVEERLFAGLADRAGLTLRGVRLRAELAHRAAELSAREAELRESREALVDAHDAERRRLERDIHDGAQQHLVALAVSLRLAHTLLPKSPERADKVLAEQEAAVAATIETLVDLSRGIYPRLLSEGGLLAAFEAARDSSPIPVRLDTGPVGRLPVGVETTAYFCAMEALQNAAKHSSANVVTLTTRRVGDDLVLTVEDDGVGFDVTATKSGAGLDNIRCRVEAVGGALSLTSAPGRTCVSLRLPVFQLTPVAAEMGG
jgi:signal transduction histidine kinase